MFPRAGLFFACASALWALLPIVAAEHGPFLPALDRLAEERRRDGAYAWGVSQDAGDPERVLGSRRLRSAFNSPA